jgi:hypothetical protein
MASPLAFWARRLVKDSRFLGENYQEGDILYDAEATHFGLISHAKLDYYVERILARLAT